MESPSVTQEAPQQRAVQDKPVCQHYWVIDRPAGPVSSGVCRLCGEQRDFQNYVEGSWWGFDVSLEQLGGGSRFPAGIDVSSAKADLEYDEDA